MNIRRICIFLVVAFLSACSGATTSSGGGTVVSNPPTVSTTSLSPDFEALIPESATLGDAPTLDIDAGFLTNAQTQSLNGPAGFWAQIFLNGPVARFRLLRLLFQRMGERISNVIANDGSVALSTTPQTFLIGTRVFFDSTRAWAVSIALKDDTSVKAVFRDVDTGEIGAYYLFEVDADGNPVKGVFAYVNPDTLSASAPSLVRFMAISFDFSDPTRNELSSTIDGYDTLADHYVVQHMQYQCNAVTDTCLGEFLRIDSAPPLREFSAHSTRLSWNESTKTICLAPVSYADGTATLGVTQEFTGPQTPDESNITEGTCTIDEPFWATRVFTPADFPKRFDDDSSGGFAAMLFGDGSSESNWDDNITSTTISDWLVGRF